AQHVARELAGAAHVAQHDGYIVGRGAGLGAGGGKYKIARYRAAHGARDGVGPHGAAHVGGRARIAAKSGVRGRRRGRAQAYQQLNIAPGSAQRHFYAVDGAVLRHVYRDAVAVAHRGAAQVFGNTGAGVDFGVVAGAGAQRRSGRVAARSGIGHERQGRRERSRAGSTRVGLAKCINQPVAIGI
nr:hypothetical protein [Tanacetum cinerariifolium]